MLLSSECIDGYDVYEYQGKNGRFIILYEPKEKEKNETKKTKNVACKKSKVMEKRIANKRKK